MENECERLNFAFFTVVIHFFVLLQNPFSLVFCLVFFSAALSSVRWPEEIMRRRALPAAWY